MNLRGVGNVMEMDAGGASTIWSANSAVLMALNLLPFPGAGLVIGLGIKLIFGDKPDKTAPHLAENVVKPILAAAQSKDYAPVMGLVYYRGGDGGYAHFTECVRRWPQTAELFYAVMMGDAIKSNDWKRFLAFLQWLDRTNAAHIKQSAIMEKRVIDNEGRD